jgi:hypothetical protein
MTEKERNQRIADHIIIGILIVFVLFLLFDKGSAMPPPAQDVRWSLAALTEGKAGEEPDNGLTFLLAAGYGQSFQLDLGITYPIASKLYGFTSVVSGNWGGGLEGRVAYLVSPMRQNGLYFGVTAGPGSHWYNVADDGQPPVLRIVGASGLLVGYSFDKWGLLAEVDRQFGLDDATDAIVPRWSVWLGLHWDLYE